MPDLDRPVNARELRAELEAVLKTIATKEDLKVLGEELRTHFDIVAESLRAEFQSMIAWKRPL